MRTTGRKGCTPVTLRPVGANGRRKFFRAVTDRQACAGHYTISTFEPHRRGIRIGRGRRWSQRASRDRWPVVQATTDWILRIIVTWSRWPWRNGWSRPRLRGVRRGTWRRKRRRQALEPWKPTEWPLCYFAHEKTDLCSSGRIQIKEPNLWSYRGTTPTILCTEWSQSCFDSQQIEPRPIPWHLKQNQLSVDWNQWRRSQEIHYSLLSRVAPRFPVPKRGLLQRGPSFR